MSKAKKGQLEKNKTYQTSPLFKDKFKPAVSKNQFKIKEFGVLSPLSNYRKHAQPLS